MIYLVDIDGTVADCTHRLHFIQSKPKDWDKFFAACSGDSPIKEVISTIQMLKLGGAEIIMVSGRSDVVRKQTEDWLAAYKVCHDGLFMRSYGDHREDCEVKSDLLEKIRTGWRWGAGEVSNKITGVFEDRQQVVDMYRSKGLRVFQVAKGDF